MSIYQISFCCIIIKLGSSTLFPTILKISIENFDHRRENQECLSLLAQSCVIHDRLVPISRGGINFQRYDAIVDDISAIRPELKTLLGEGGGREGKRRISTRPFCPSVKGAASRVLLRYTFFHHDAINLARICTPDRLVGITFRAKRPANIRCRSITTILLPA